MIERTRPEIKYLFDRLAIRDCVERYCRGLDRHDPELLASAFHSDAIDQHGDFVGTLLEFLTFAEKSTVDSRSHTHNITCHFAEVDGDVAHAESYVLTVLLKKDVDEVMVLGGRYIDRLEFREGEWRITLRRVVRDWRFDADATLFRTEPDGFPLGRQDRSDLSYQRPLEAPAL
jgi:hypothetical protein